MGHGGFLMGQAARAGAAMEFAGRFVYSSGDLPSASPELRLRKQQEEMMLRLSNQFHSSGLSQVSEKSAIPAGYTYLAQFAVHDMMRSTPLATEAGEVNEHPANEETAGLDLRSLYGAGPEGSPSLYEAGTVGGKRGRLRIGYLNKGSPGFEKGAPVDIPREPRPPAAAGAAPTEPVLADSRNADTLILAQLTALFIQFHNVLFDMSSNAGNPDPFRRARKTAAAAYRKIVWDDLVARLADRQVFDWHTRTLSSPRERGWNIPKESAFAVLRFGHTMVRGTYLLNDRIPAVGSSLAVSTLLDFVDKDSGQTVPARNAWKIDWSRFFETSRNQDDGFNHSAPIRPAMAQALQELPKKKAARFPPKEGPQISLAFRSLMRGFYVKLPTGQAAARAVRASLGFDFTVLTSRQIADALTAASMQGKCGLGQVQCLNAADIAVLAERTPLFLYILLEAEIVGHGSRLGPVGSDFLCHAFAGGIRLPADDPDRNIEMISGIGAPGTMPDLLHFLGLHESPVV
jgi:Animal haem peroxidase